MAVQKQRSAAAASLQGADDIGTPLITTIDGAVRGVLLELLPVGVPHVDLDADARHVVSDEFLDRGLVARDARDCDHLLQEGNRLVAVLIDVVQNPLSAVAAHTMLQGSSAAPSPARSARREARSGYGLKRFGPPCRSPPINGQPAGAGV